jgi:hypothetical protein
MGMNLKDTYDPAVAFRRDIDNANENSIAMVVMVLILAGMVALLHWSKQKGEENDQKILAYINAHQCQVENLTPGHRGARAVYHCTEGQLLDVELRKEALK